MTSTNEIGLVAHARRELEACNEDPDVREWMIRVVKEFASYGHSGGSAPICISMLAQLLQFKPLTALTDDPDEWYYHGPDMWDGENGIWQNKRDGEAFSTDRGKTYTLLSEREKFLHVSAKHDEPRPETAE